MSLQETEQTAVGTTTTATTTAATGPTPPRWWLSVVAGCVVGLPLGWLLSYGVALPFFLGLFFFALSGLVIGAVMYRVGAPARPVPPKSILAAVAVVVGSVWSFSLVKEAGDYPHDMGNRVCRDASVAVLPDGMTPDTLMADVESHVRDVLRTEFGSSGVVGYVRFVLTAGSMDYPISTLKNPLKLTPPQAGFWWALRAVLTLGLLWFGVHSTVSPLRFLHDKPSTMAT
jgi:hypothetical protein